MHETSLSSLVYEVLHVKTTNIRRLSGGCIGDVYRVELADGRSIVAKVADGTGVTLAVEGYMLRYLKEHSRLPVPEVYHSADTLLLMEFIEGESELDAGAQEHAAVHLRAPLDYLEFQPALTVPWQRPDWSQQPQRGRENRQRYLRN